MTTPKTYQAEIDAELQEIIPAFFDNTRQEIQELAAANAVGDYDTLQRLGHSIKGAALGYGFADLAEIGLQIENAARQGRGMDAVKELVQAAQSYIDTVIVIYR